MSENLNEIRFRLKSLRIQQGLSLQELAQRTGFQNRPSNAMRPAAFATCPLTR